MEFHHIFKTFLTLSPYPWIWTIVFISAVGLSKFSPWWRPRLVRFFIFLSAFLVMTSWCGPLYLFTRPGFLKALGHIHFLNYQKEKLEPRQYYNLGWTAFSPPQLSYLNFPQQKKPHTIRVGLFGDSHVQGEEVAFGEDVSAQLLRYLNKIAPAKNFEVLNFGVSGHGVAQSMLMWEYLGKSYNLDVAVFMPFDFHCARDLNFVSPQSESFTPAHARFYSTPKGYRLAEINQNNWARSQLEFYSPWGGPRSWPMQLHGPPLWRGFSKINPVYQLMHPPLETECYNLYSELLNRLPLNLRVVVFTTDVEAKYFKTQNLNPHLEFLVSRSLNYVRQVKSWFMAPQGHLSVFGNELVASELAQWIGFKNVISELDLKAKLVKLQSESTLKKTIWIEDQISTQAAAIEATSPTHKIFMAQNGTTLAESRLIQYPMPLHQSLPWKEKPLETLVLFNADFLGEFFILNFPQSDLPMLKEKFGRLRLVVGENEEFFCQIKKISSTIFFCRSNKYRGKQKIIEGELFLGKKSLGHFSWDEWKRGIFPIKQEAIIFRTTSAAHASDIKFLSDTQNIQLVINSPTQKISLPLFHWKAHDF